MTALHHRVKSRAECRENVVDGRVVGAVGVDVLVADRVARRRCTNVAPSLLHPLARLVDVVAALRRLRASPSTCAGAGARTS